MSNSNKITHNHKIVLQAQTFDFCTAGQVLIAIASHAAPPANKSEGWRCYPSRATIAKLIGVAERTVLTHTDRLIEAGLLKIIKQGKKGIANLYELNLKLIFNPTAAVFRTLTQSYPSPESQDVVKQSEEKSKAATKKWFDLNNFKKKDKTTYPQPTQKPIQSETGYTVKTSDQNDPTNNSRFKDLKENNAQSAIPSSKIHFPSKRQIEMIVIGIKSGLKKANEAIQKLMSQNAPDLEINSIHAEMVQYKQQLEHYMPAAKTYGIEI